MMGSAGRLHVVLAEMQARRQRAASDRGGVDHTGERPEGFDVASTPLPPYEPIPRRSRWWQRRRP
jgi:hypothetical protein